jgi:Cache domain
VIRRRSLFQKYVVVLVLLLSGALLASGLVQLYFSYEETQSSLVVLQAEKASGAASRIEAFLGEIQRQVAGSTLTPGLTETLSSADREDEFRRLLRQEPAITDLTYVDPFGREQHRVSRLALNRTGSGSDLSQDTRFLQARGGHVAYSPLYFRDESEPYLSLSVGELAADGGVIIAEVNLKFIWDVVSRIQVGQSGYAYVVDERGQLVGPPRPQPRAAAGRPVRTAAGARWPAARSGNGLQHGDHLAGPASAHGPRDG